jgi:hypothetical protein
MPLFGFAGVCIVALIFLTKSAGLGRLLVFAVWLGSFAHYGGLVNAI